MNVHKEKCKRLKAIRKKLADGLGIDLRQRECTFEGECSGTCPKCRQEEEALNRALLGKAAAVAVSAGLLLTGCGNPAGGTRGGDGSGSKGSDRAWEKIFDLDFLKREKTPELTGESPLPEEISGYVEVAPSEEESGGITELEGDVEIVEPGETPMDWEVQGMETMAPDWEGIPSGEDAESGAER